MSLPEDVEAVLVRCVGAYIRSAPREDLPRNIRHLRGFRPKALSRHRDQVLALLDDESMRARMSEWLDDAPSGISKEDADALRLASRRPDGWEAELAARSTVNSHPDRGSVTDGRADALERERQKTARAREEARRAKDDAHKGIESERAKSAALTNEVEGLKRRLSAAESAAEEARGEAVAARAELDRERRNARRAEAKLKAQGENHRDSLRRERKEKAELSRAVTALERRVAELERPVRARPATPGRSGPQRRRPLPVPQGLLDDAPETLDRWLADADVRLLIDGYNVTKAEDGFGDLTLEGQRDRLIEGVYRLAQRKGVNATIVFDGSEDVASDARRARGPVKVVYSGPGDSADDHLIALLATLPASPVVFATSDRELQERARDLGATIATSKQLLTLLR